MLANRIAEMLAGKQKWEFTIECGRGETYATSKPVLYGHSTYPRGSVLAGRDQRVWLEQWDTWDAARAELAEVKKAVKKFKYDDQGETGGSSFVSIADTVSHLPDDTDY